MKSKLASADGCRDVGEMSASLFAAGARFGFVNALFASFFKQFREASGAGEHRAAGYFAGLAATNNRRLFARAAEAGPAASDGALAWSRRLLAKFGDLICIKHRQCHPDFGRFVTELSTTWYKTWFGWHLSFQRPLL